MAVAYLGGHGAMPPTFGPTMKIFYRRLYMKRCIFAVFQQISEKMGEFAASIERSKAKCFSFRRGGFAPLTPRPGALPLDPAGGSAPRPPL